MNVLPILTHTDALSMYELDAVRLAVRRDLGEAFKDEDGNGFGIFGMDNEEELNRSKVNRSLMG